MIRNVTGALQLRVMQPDVEVLAFGMRGTGCLGKQIGAATEGFVQLIAFRPCKTAY
jgi:hypothetical protein